MASGSPHTQSDTAATTGGAVQTISITVPQGIGAQVTAQLIVYIGALPTTSESIVVKKLNIAGGTLDPVIYSTDPSEASGADYSLCWVERIVLDEDDQITVTYANTDDNNISAELMLQGV